MLQEQIVLVENRKLLVDKELLDKAGLHGRLKVVIWPGEIRILPEFDPNTADMLDALAGCLGPEAATEYDFELKIGGLYEAR